jgi:hypothetical protein
MQTIFCPKRSVSATARNRAEKLELWIRENSAECLEEQKHLDAGSAERAYWHYGYLSALKDVLKLMSSADN